jgi:hypothetical protein
MHVAWTLSEPGVGPDRRESGRRGKPGSKYHLLIDATGIPRKV